MASSSSAKTTKTLTETQGIEIISNVGKQLSQKSRLNKDSIVKLLKEAEKAFRTLNQSESLQSAIEPLSASLVRHNLLHHTDKDVKVLVAGCFCQIMRVLAPAPPYSDEVLTDIFNLIVSMFSELADTTSPYFSKRVEILETVARLKCCLLMLDIGCSNLVVEMFTVFFAAVRKQHQQSLKQSMLSIMSLIIEDLDERVPQPLLDVILQNLLKAEEDASRASYELAVDIVRQCTVKLEPLINGFLSSCFSGSDEEGSDLRDFYHEIIFEVYKCDKQLVLAVIPRLTEELLAEQVDVRIKAVKLLGKLFVASKGDIACDYTQLFSEFFRRFSDKSVEVRVTALQCATACYLSNPAKSVNVLDIVKGRLLDFDDKVRTQAVITLCDLFKSNLECIPQSSELILKVTDRLRDKKVSVRKNAMRKLLDLYRNYCIKCSERINEELADHFEQIPGRILMLCYDKDCKEFRPHIMELVLADDLFPPTLSVEEKMKHWIHMFSLFTGAHTKALNTILSQKWRLQTEMQSFLAFRKKEKETSIENLQQRTKSSFVKMSASFADPLKAEECFQKLNQMKDNSIFKDLAQLLDGKTNSLTSCNIRDTFLKRVGNKHPLYEFLRILSAKCSHNLFGSEHIFCILSDLSEKHVDRKKKIVTSSINLLMTITNVFPSLLQGSEELLRKLLLEEDNPFCDKLLQILSKAGSHICMQLSDIHTLLERLCLEGTRVQSKYAILSIVALGGASVQMVFSDLYEKLVDSLKLVDSPQVRENGPRLPTVLLSLGFIAQYSVPTFESREEEITAIIHSIFGKADPGDPIVPSDEEFPCSSSCKLKIYGLKTLVKSFLPRQGTHIRRHVNKLLDILLKMLPEGKTSADFSSVSDKAHIRLAAAKAVLRLARRWDLHISPQIFSMTILKARDPSSPVRRSFLDKVHKLLKERAVPIRYACAFALGASDCSKDVQADALKYLEEFIKDYGKDARVHQGNEDLGGSLTGYPEYILVFLIPVLAHDLGFSSENCQDEETYAQFCSPLVVTMRALVNATFVDSSKNVVYNNLSYLPSIFLAIKKAGDAVDARTTHKLHILAEIGILILKELSADCTLLSHTLSQIKLPSSFYSRLDPKHDEASSCSEFSDNLNLLTGFPLDKRFIKRILHASEPEIVQPPSPPVKCGRKLQNDTIQVVGVKHSTNLPTSNHMEFQKSRSKKEDTKKSSEEQVEPHVRQQVSGTDKDKVVASRAASRSFGAHLVVSDADNHMKRVSESADQNLGLYELSSSCGSVITRPPMSESQVSDPDMQLADCTPTEDLGRQKTKTDSVVNRRSKNAQKAGNTNEMLIGKQVKVWSSVDNRFCSGTVDEFNSQDSSHKITSDSGDVEVLNLASENWEFIDSPSSPKEEGNKVDLKLRKCQDLCQQKESSYCDAGVNAGDKPVKRQKNTSNKRKGSVITGATKEKVQGQKPDSGASEVIDVEEDVVARRTRSRKA
ncbi:hypothetical protein C5167_013360 [Papaver somniferum]|uniref:Sister chromatid cohesion protein n=1 Tax=Papaver somniferum TaxID=3469 RepID=A0A4Y7J439_PAPSO|nr:hypothetical protein C5167_013360 [Papaver somniferum]